MLTIVPSGRTSFSGKPADAVRSVMVPSPLSVTDRSLNATPANRFVIDLPVSGFVNVCVPLAIPLNRGNPLRAMRSCSLKTKSTVLTRSSPQICTSEVPVMCSWERSTSCACAEAVTPSGASSATAPATATRPNLFICCSPLRGAHRGAPTVSADPPRQRLASGGTGIFTVRPHKKLTLLSRAASVGWHPPGAVLAYPPGVRQWASYFDHPCRIWIPTISIGIWVPRCAYYLFCAAAPGG